MKFHAATLVVAPLYGILSSCASSGQGFLGSSTCTGDSSSFEGTPDGVCHQLPNLDSIRVQSNDPNCDVTVYSDMYCSSGALLAPQGDCMSGFTIRSFSEDCRGGSAPLQSSSIAMSVVLTTKSSPVQTSVMVQGTLVTVATTPIVVAPNPQTSVSLLVQTSVITISLSPSSKATGGFSFATNGASSFFPNSKSTGTTLPNQATTSPSTNSSPTTGQSLTSSSQSAATAASTTDPAAVAAAGGLSQTAKIAIGVAVPVLALIIAAAILIGIRLCRARARKRAAGYSASTSGIEPTTEPGTEVSRRS